MTKAKSKVSLFVEISSVDGFHSQSTMPLIIFSFIHDDFPPNKLQALSEQRLYFPSKLAHRLLWPRTLFQRQNHHL